MYLCRYANSETDKKNSKKLWAHCFKDSKDYIEFYFDNRYKNETFLLSEDSETKTLAGGMHHIEFDFNFCNVPQKSVYIEALGVYEKFRRQGVMTSLMNETFKIARERDLRELFLIPRDPSIYRPFGFGFSHSLIKYELTFETLLENSVVDTSLTVLEMTPDNHSLIEEYVTFFNNKFKNFRSHIEKSFANMEYFIREFYIGKGKFFVVKRDNVIVGAFGCFPQKTSLEVRELSFDTLATFKSICSYIHPMKETFREKPFKDLFFKLDSSASLEKFFHNELQITKIVIPTIMTRILRIRTALFEYFKSIDTSQIPKTVKSITISVIDNQFPDNTGIYLVSFDDFTVNFFAKSNQSDFDFEITIDGLTELLYSTTKPEVLIALGRMTLKHNKVCAYLDDIFPKKSSYINEFIL